MEKLLEISSSLVSELSVVFDIKKELTQKIKEESVNIYLDSKYKSRAD
jgi:hypothetical protein